MAEIDPHVLALLEPLLRSRMEHLAGFAIARIEQAEQSLPFIDGDQSDPFRPHPNEQERDRARRQLRLAGKVVAGILRRELDLFDRSRELIEDNGRRGDGPGPAAISKIMLIGEAGEGGETADLLSPGRREAIDRLLGVWERAVGSALDGLGSDEDR